MVQALLKDFSGPLSLGDFEKVMGGLTNTTPTSEILTAFKVFDKTGAPPRPLGWHRCAIRSVRCARLQ